jgi:hypothetical protein
VEIFVPGRGIRFDGVDMKAFAYTALAGLLRKAS